MNLNLTRASQRIKALLYSGAAAMLFTASAAHAQEQRTASDGTFDAGEIVVTARKRAETVTQSPVVVQAVGLEKIADLHITDVYGIQAAVPGLQLNTAFAGVGSSIYMRGLGTGQAAIFIDQPVLLSIDGIGVSTGAFYRGALFDLQQIEVLKGPQALFFGKSTSAGIIALHTANPTASWSSRVTGGYEFVGDEALLDGYIAGPITDKLGIRVAGYASDAKGWFYNPDPATTARRVPNERTFGGRATLRYRDGSLTAQLKSSFSHMKNNMDGSTNQDFCASGNSSMEYFNQFTPRCRLDRTMNGLPDPEPFIPGTVFPAFDPTPFQFASPAAIFQDGRKRQKTNTMLHVFEVNYEVAPNVTLTSLTGFSQTKVIDVGINPVPSIGFAPLAGDIKASDFSQELRIASDWKDSWFNFIIGGLYNPGKLRNRTVVAIPAFGIYTDNTGKIKNDNNSVFGQATVKPLNKLEISAGVRYSEVKKRISSVVSFNNYSLAAFGVDTNGVEQAGNIAPANREVKESATTPEFTISFHPTEDSNIFASYKKGYKGPGFNLSLTDVLYTPTGTTNFPGERVKGFEGGVKANLYDRRLFVSLIGYRYKYSGLQVAVPENLQVIIRPDAAARVQGIEASFTLRPSIVPGLTIDGFLNYNDSHYTDFPTGKCWSGQLPSQGCINNRHDLSGRRLAFAAKWVGSAGLNYETAVARNFRLTTSLQTQYSSPYNFSPELNPQGRQGSYWLLDGALRLKPQSEAWEVALIGRNLTNKIYATSGGDRGIAGAPTGVPGSVFAYVARPRQVLLQFSVFPSEF